jgi:hypothetical protein
MIPKWTKHDGGRRPVAENTIVIVRYRNGNESHPCPAGGWRWENWTSKDSPDHDQVDWDIIDWRAG